jgi:hypothetical protein
MDAKIQVGRKAGCSVIRPGAGVYIEIEDIREEPKFYVDASGKYRITFRAVGATRVKRLTFPPKVR